MSECVFCDKFRSQKPVFENDLVYSCYDEFPVSKGHMLFIAKRHVKTFFDMTEKEQQSMFELVNQAKKYLDKKYNPDGYNIGFNCGEAAGQSIMHVHLHLIPRYIGDTKNPRGGVRGVISSKQNY